MKKKTLVSVIFITVFFIVVSILIWDKSRYNESIISKDHVNAALGPEPATIDPGKNIDGYVSVYISHVFEGLTKLNDDNKIVPAMAERWEVSSDGLTYTFYLKDNIKWSDGQDVTANDFEYAWKRVLSPQTASLYVYHLLYIKNGEKYNQGLASSDEVGIKAINKKTLEVKLEKPTSFFISLTSLQPFYPVRQDIIEKYGDSWTQNANTYIGNGPFIMMSWNHNEKIDMAVNPYYYDKDKIKIKSISWKLVDNDTAIVNAFETGEIDFLSGFFNTSDLSRLKEEGKVRRVDSLTVSYIIFNTKRAPFDNPKVRLALSLAIDRRTLTDNILREGDVPANAFIPYGMPSFEDGSDFRKDSEAKAFLIDSANIEEAKKLLAEAGYPNGEGLKTFDFLNAQDSSNQKISEYIQAQWAKIGVKTKINALESKVRSQYRSEGKYDITKGSWGGDYLDPNTFLTAFTSESPNNYGRWQYKPYDEAVSQLVSAEKRKDGISAAHKAEDILMSQMPIIPLFYRSQNALVNPKLKGVYMNSLNQIMFTGAYWVK